MSRILHRLEDGVLVLALATMLGMAIYQIILRNFFDSGLVWAESFVRVLVLWIAMLGAMVATREDRHINIDAISRFLPVTVARLAAVVTRLFAAVVCGLVAFYSLELVMFEFEDQTIAFAMVPNWVTQSVIPFGFAVMSLRFLWASLVQLFTLQAAD